jgi:hypothetical protein
MLYQSEFKSYILKECGNIINANCKILKIEKTIASTKPLHLAEDFADGCYF